MERLSMTNYSFVEASEEHIQALLEIYNFYVLNTTVTFDLIPLALSEMRNLVLFNDSKYNTFVIHNNKEIIGYAIISQYRKRGAYDKTAEIAVYLKNLYTGLGIGSIAVKYLEDYASKNNMHTLLAVISAENISSIRLFEKNKYVKCAHYIQTGYKFDRWIDVVVYQKIL